MVICLQCCRYQKCGNYNFWGNSGIWTPAGIPLAKASDKTDELIIIHNIELKKEIEREHSDFYYFDDYKKYYSKN